MEKRVLVVIDMQNGVLATPRHDWRSKVAQINRLIASADHTIFIQHAEGDMQEGSTLWEVIAELHQPPQARYVTKTACDAFWHTQLAAELAAIPTRTFTVCGCATDYCVDTTIKVGASLGYAITVAADAHTTADRQYASAAQLIGQHNEVWAGLSLPGNAVNVKSTQAILQQWQAPT